MDRKTSEELAEKHRDWPNSVRSRKELDDALEAGEASGVSDSTVLEIAENMIARMKANGEI